MTTSTRTFSEAIENAIARRLAEVFVARFGEVVSYDATNQSVSAKPLQKEWRKVDEDTEESVSLPILTKVPVVFNGPITFPVAAGDVVLLVFLDRSIDLWKSNGGETEAADKRNHSMRDAVAIPMVHPFNAPRANVPTNAITTHGLTHLGAYDATEPALKGDALVSALGDWADKVQAAVATANAGAGTTLLPFTGAFKTAIAAAKSSLVKVK